MNPLSLTHLFPQERAACRVQVTVSQHVTTGDVRVVVESDLPGVQALHWGVVPWGPFGDNHWQPPVEELRPHVRPVTWGIAEHR